MSTARSLFMQRVKETVGISKGTYDEELAQSIAKLTELDDKLTKLKHAMTVSLEKAAKTAAAARLSVMEGVIGLCVDLPSGEPSECGTYRSVCTELQQALPTRLTAKFEEVVISHINDWQAKINETMEEFKVYSTARVKLDHYKEKVDGLQQKITMKAGDMKLIQQLDRNRKKLEEAQTEYTTERTKLMDVLHETFANSALWFDKLLLRLMQFDMQYYKECHAVSAGFAPDVATLQARLKDATNKTNSSANSTDGSPHTVVTETKSVAVPSGLPPRSTTSVGSQNSGKSSTVSSTNATPKSSGKRFSLTSWLKGSSSKPSDSVSVGEDEPDSSSTPQAETVQQQPPQPQPDPQPTATTSTGFRHNIGISNNINVNTNNNPFPVPTQTPAPAPVPSNDWATFDDGPSFAPVKPQPQVQPQPTFATTTTTTSLSGFGGSFDPWNSNATTTSASHSARTPFDDGTPKATTATTTGTSFGLPPPPTVPTRTTTAHNPFPTATKQPQPGGSSEFQSFTANSLPIQTQSTGTTGAGYTDPFQAPGHDNAAQNNPFADMFA